MIALLTDFGTSDTYVGQMKAVIAAIAPNDRIIDLTHEVPPQNVMAATVQLDQAVDALGNGTIVVAVVDPGVGTNRAAIAVQAEHLVLVGPDNGLFTLTLDRFPLKQAVRLTNREYQRSETSSTFHGRDIFAPVAAHLATGVKLEELGEPMSALVKLDVPEIRCSEQQLEATVLLIDRFGNLITNLKKTDFDQWRSTTSHYDISINLADYSIRGINQTYADATAGKPLAYFGSGGRLEIAMRNEDAAKCLNLCPQNRIILQRCMKSKI